MDPNKECLNGVYPFSEVKPEIEESYLEYFQCYLTDRKAKTCVIEDNYIDKDYLIDFSNFYARSYNVDEKYTTRYHFFSEIFTKDDLIHCLENEKDPMVARISSSYLGFIVIKPIKNCNTKNYIGRTLLITYDVEDKGEKRFFIKQKYPVSLFGIPLEIETLPFQSQDQAVGGCATSACWTALHPLHSLFGVEMLSPSEITEISVLIPNEDRNFPSVGLTLPQMKNHFTTLGLETEFIDLSIKSESLEKYYTTNDDMVSDVVKAYNHIGLPIIAALRIYFTKDQKNPPRHAIVISGFRHKNCKVTELYIHDDQIGPYHRVKPVNNKFSSWKNDWTEKDRPNRKRAYAIEPYKLLIPIYPKMRLNFLKIYIEYLKIKREFERSKKDENLKADMHIELFLTKLNDYKEFLWREKFDDKSKILSKPFPRFIWVIRTFYKGKPQKDLMYDGTCVYTQKLLQIDFK
jgi:hypothetical protein